MRKFFAIISKEVTRIIISAILLITAVIIDNSGMFIPSLIFYLCALIVCGTEVFIDAVKGILRRDLLDEKFLMSIASVGAMIVGEFSEGVAVMLFFLVGETFEHMAVRRSRNSIKALMDFCPDEANLLTDGGELRVDADELEIGSKILIRTGERVPVNCRILSGKADVDTSSMTGEAVPRAVKEGELIESGVVILSGLLTAETVKRAEESSAQRILELVENASENKSKEEAFITAFSRIYTPIVVALAFLLAFIPPIFKITSFNDSIYRALIFLVISCPCALVISVPMAFFGAIGGSASRGILFKGGNVFSRLANAHTIALDKTGTITSGEFSVSEIIALGVSKEELISLASTCEYGSNHPIAKCIRALSTEEKMPESSNETAGEGTVSIVDDSEIAVGNAALMKKVGALIPNELNASVYVAKNGVLIGAFVISDRVKDNVAKAVEKLRSVGINRALVLSGDKPENVKKASESVGITEYYGNLSPEDKYEKLKTLALQSEGGTIYVGDGINDAPSLALADVGVAMGGVGQDSAIEAADVVLMSDELLKIPESILIAKKTLQIAKQNIFFALAVKLLVMILGAVGAANMWLAVFADVGVAVLAILNSMRTLLYSRKQNL